MKKFDYRLNYEELDLRKHPELYTVGRGEQGVLMVEPYKSEILPYWRFKTPEIATESSEKIYELFLEYKKKEGFRWHGYGAQVSADGVHAGQAIYEP